MATNEHTGDELKSKPLSEQGKSNWDVIFGDKNAKPVYDNEKEENDK